MLEGADMTELENTILETLLRLEEAVGKLRSPGPKPDLLAIFSRLEELAGQLPPEASPDLRHFLHKKSYEKARMLLQGLASQTPRGSCPR
jgi:hypothetical protein